MIWLYTSLLFAQEADVQDLSVLEESAITAQEQSAPTLSVMPYDEWSHDGTTVYRIPDHRAPIVEFRLYIAVGKWSGISGIEEALNILPYDEEGALRGQANKLAVDLDINVSDTYSSIGIRALKDDVDEVLQLFQDVISNDSFEAAELKRMQQTQQMGWKQSLKDPNFIGQQKAIDLLFPDETDARRINFTEPRSVEKDATALNAIQDRVFQQPDKLLVIAGDASVQEAQEWSKTLLSSFVPATETLPVANITSTSTRENGRADRAVIEQPNTNQVYFYYTRDLIPMTSEDYACFLVADFILSGHFFSRLYTALRHEDGDTYGVRSQEFWTVNDPGAYIISTFTREDNATAMEGKLLAVMQEFHSNGITEEELQMAMSNLQGKLRQEQQAPEQIMRERAFEHRNQLEAGFEIRSVEAVQQLTLEEVNAFIRRFYDAQQFTMILVQPEEK